MGLPVALPSSTTGGKFLSTTTGPLVSMINTLWSLTAHDGSSAFYTSPVFVPLFVSPTYSGPAFVFQGFDWYIYVVNAITGVPLTGWPVPTAGPCYGRCQAFDVNNDGFTEVFGSTHGAQSANGGGVIGLRSDGTSLWTKLNVYQDEGFNTGLPSCAGETRGTLTAAITTVGQTAITVTNFATWPTVFPFNFSIDNEIMSCTAGGGSSTNWTITRGQLGTTAATHLINAVLNGTILSNGGTGITGGTTSSGGNFTLTVGGTNPNWPATAWTRTAGFGFGAYLKIVSGTGIGQIREISGVGSGNVISTVNAWTINPDATSIWQIMPRYVSDFYVQHAGTLAQEAGIWYLYTTADDNTLVKRNATTGAKIWRFWAKENNEPYPLVQDVNSDGVPEVLFNSVDGNSYCILQNGTQLWKYLSPVGVDSFISAGDIDADGITEVLINQRRSGNAAAGRTLIINGTTGALKYMSTDNYGDMDSRALIVPRNDGTLQSNIFTVGDSGFCRMLNFKGETLWQDSRADTNGLTAFNCSPQLADINYNGVNEIVAPNQQGVIYFYSVTGTRIASLGPNSRIGSALVGIEGVPYIGDVNNDGLLEILIPMLDGTIRLMQFDNNSTG